MKLSLTVLLLVAASGFTQATPIFDAINPWATTPPSTKHDYILIPYWAKQSSKPGRWEVKVHGYALNKLQDAGYILRSIEKMIGIFLDGATIAKIKERLKYAYAAIASTPLVVKRVKVFGEAAKSSSAWVNVGNVQTDSQAAFDLNLPIDYPEGKAGQWVQILLQLSDGSSVSTTVQLISDNANEFTVITDMDDTIKDTGVLSGIQALKSTFYLPPKPIENAPKFFQYLKTNLSKNSQAAFHVISASPFELHAMLKKFVSEAKFPRMNVLPSPIRLRYLLSLARLDLRKYKRDGSLAVMSQFPHRKFMLIGDSGQMDAEGYGDVVRMAENGKQVSCILIRKVVGQNKKIEAVKNTPQRYAAAFQGIPDSKWRVFEDAQELLNVDFSQGGCYNKDEVNKMAAEIKEMEKQQPVPKLDCEMGKVEGGAANLLSEVDGNQVYMRPSGTESLVPNLTGDSIDVCTVPTSDLDYWYFY